MPDPTSEGSAFFAGFVRDHARMEERLTALERAAWAVSTAEHDAGALREIAGVLAFFAAEGAVHQAHEEQTLFPRLRPLPAFKQILSALEFQHRMTDDEGRQLAACVERFAAGRSRELLRLALRFVEMNRGHMVSEERALFPLAASSLASESIAEMRREMERREAEHRSAARR